MPGKTGYTFTQSYDIISTRGLEMLMNLVRAVEQEAHLAAALLDPCCAPSIDRPLVHRVLAVVGPLLLIDDDDDNLFLTKARQVIVNLTGEGGLVISTLDQMLYDKAEHMRLTAIKALDEIVHTEQVPHHLKYSISDVLKMGLVDEGIRVEMFRPCEFSEADFLKWLCSIIVLVIENDESNYFAREKLLDVHQLLLLELDAEEIEALDTETTRVVLEILVQPETQRGGCSRLEVH